MRSSCTPCLEVATAHVDAFVLHALFGGGHIFQVHRRPIALSYNQVVILVGGRQLSLGLEQEGAIRAIKLSRSGIAGAVLDCVSQIFEGHIADCHRRRIRLDSHGRLRAVDGNLADPG